MGLLASRGSDGIKIILAKVNTITICVDEEWKNLSLLLVADAGLLPQFKFSLAQKKMSHEENPLALASATSSY